MENQYYWQILQVNQRRLAHGVDSAQFAGEQYEWAMDMHDRYGDEFYAETARSWARSLHQSLEVIDEANRKLNLCEQEIGY